MTSSSDLTNEKKGRKKIDVSLFFSDLDNFLLENDIQSLHIIYIVLGSCIKRNSLAHALLIFSSFYEKGKNNNTDVSTMLMSLITSFKPKGEDKELKLIEILEKDSSIKDSDYYKNIIKDDFWSCSLNDLVLLLCKNEKSCDEKFYTLVIRFYCQTNSEKMGFKLYNELKEKGFIPHNRTFIPLIEMCQLYQELKDLHVEIQNTLQKNNQTPSLEVYFHIFKKLFEFVKKGESQDYFIHFLTSYSNYYSYITPEIASLFKDNLNYRKDIGVDKEGNVIIDKMVKKILDKISVSDTSRENLAKLIFNTTDKIQTFEKYVKDKGIEWDVVIDGANVALQDGSFKSDYIESIVNWCMEHEYKVLIILHQNRKKFLVNQYLYDSKNVNIYYTPFNNNDDYFSLYAALINDAYIVSNDEFRDHANLIWANNLLLAKNFKRWYSARQITFTRKFSSAINFSKITHKKSASELNINLPNDVLKEIQIDNSFIYMPVNIESINNNSTDRGTINIKTNISEWVVFQIAVT